MAFDIRAIFSRSLGGRPDREAPPPVAAPEEVTDEEMPGSPIVAAGTSAASPDTADMAQGGASAATALIPEGLAAMPSASVDSTRSGLDDDSVTGEQAELVAEVAIGAAMANGDLDDDERADLVESLREVPGMEEIDEGGLDEVIERLHVAAEDQDFVSFMEDRFDEISGTLTDPVLRRAAFQLAVYFAAWDGELSDEEVDLLDALAEAFEIPDQEARWLREATLVEAGEEGRQHDAMVL